MWAQKAIRQNKNKVYPIFQHFIQSTLSKEEKNPCINICHCIVSVSVSPLYFWKAAEYEGTETFLAVFWSSVQQWHGLPANLIRSWSANVCPCTGISLLGKLYSFLQFSFKFFVQIVLSHCQGTGRELASQQLSYAWAISWDTVTPSIQLPTLLNSFLVDHPCFL